MTHQRALYQRNFSRAGMRFLHSWKIMFFKKIEVVIALTGQTQRAVYLKLNQEQLYTAVRVAPGVYDENASFYFWSSNSDFRGSSLGR